MHYELEKMLKPNYETYKNIFQDEQFPLAFVDLDILDQNISAILARAKGTKIRIASKSIRIPAILKYILEKSAQFDGIMAYHPNEALALSKMGFDNILLGYPYIHSNEIAPLLEEVKNGKLIIFMVDDIAQINIIEKEAQKANIKAKVCIDVDMSSDFGSIHFGVYRSSITSPEKLDNLLHLCAALKHIEVIGLMGYEAQIAGVNDAVKGQTLKNTVIQYLKKKSIKEVAQKRAKAIEILKKYGINNPLVNAGGTGSIESSITENGVTEITVGSGFFASHLFDHYKLFKHLPAAAFALQITRNPQKNIFTCAGGGYIASGETGIIKQPKPYLPENIQLTKNEGTGEVQTPIINQSNIELKIGDPIFFRHSKAGELFERFNDVYFVKNNQIITSEKTIRGLNISTL